MASLNDSNNITTLYLGLATDDAGTVQYDLAEDITHFKFILVSCMTNSDYQSMLIFNNYNAIAGNHAFVAMAGSTAGLVANFPVQSSCYVSFPSTKKFSQLCFYINSNWRLRVCGVYGINKFS